MYFALVYYLKNYPSSIDSYRQKHDPRVAVTQPHLTFVFPVDAEIGQENLVQHVSHMLRDQKLFQVTFEGISTSWDNLIFLNVSDGKERIESIHDALYSGILSPHLSTKISYAPHVTLGTANATSLADAEVLNLHFTITIDRITLIRCQDDKTPHEWEKEFVLQP